MSSFLKKLKKGMGIDDIPVLETEKEEEKSEEEISERKKTAPFQKKKRSKVKIKAKSVEAQTKDFKRAEGEIPENKIEPTLEEKNFALPPLSLEETKKEEIKPTQENFTLKDLGNQEGQLVVDVYQTEREIVIQSAVAGVKPKDLDISIEEDVVSIKGYRQQPKENGEKNYFYQECYWGPFSRQIILPEETDPNFATAEIKEGVLTIRIPKIDRKNKKRIEVNG